MPNKLLGEVVYNQEVDKHFPHLTVGQTLEFAAAARTPSHRFPGVSRKEFSKHIAQVGTSNLDYAKQANYPGILRTIEFEASETNIALGHHDSFRS